MKQLWRHRRPSAGPSPFDLIDFAIVDLETTGWAPEEATITEVGAVLVCGGRVRAQFSSLVNTGSAIPEQVAELTGISDAMVASAPPLSTVLAGFFSFAQGCVLAAHFDARIKPRHRALPDALATADVLTALLRRLAATGASTLAEAGCV